MSEKMSTQNEVLDTLGIVEGPLSVDLIRLYNLRARLFRIGAISGIVWFVLLIIRQFFGGYPSILQAAILLAIGATAVPFGIGFGTYLTEIRLKRTESKFLEQKKRDW